MRLIILLTLIGFIYCHDVECMEKVTITCNFDEDISGEIPISLGTIAFECRCGMDNHHISCRNKYLSDNDADLNWDIKYFDDYYSVIAQKGEEHVNYMITFECENNIGGLTKFVMVMFIVFIVLTFVSIRLIMNIYYQW